MITNPYRNGIMSMFDQLCFELKFNGWKYDLARNEVKKALNECSEVEANLFIKRVYNLCSEVLCLTKTQN